ncbi:septum site-determining protein MinC [Seinonella peptonophila]|uniref:Probable septum site-determining protein MinC n=1 Tax=Seinonella peptonophila TaxID=112248 RepID=A0A1M4TTI9_9BACL|nr:septum site-determining protein MinC [Seinonella peptonophila]SHE47810.1 septum site-determining protein MinC [Seinonella peptonophila]
MGKVLKPGVTIKGTKEGLLFFLDDSRPFTAIMNELKYKLEHNNAAHIWDGPEMKVQIKLGKRQITKQEELELRNLFAIRKNLQIQGFESEAGSYLLEPEHGIQMLVGTVRSGQVLQHVGDLLFAGDVNPGGIIQSTGSIFVLGALRGLAHAGVKGDHTAIIAASILRPTQLRIAEIISRPPDHWEEKEVEMQFAYVHGEQISVEKMHLLSQIRPEKEWKEPYHRGI